MAVQVILEDALALIAPIHHVVEGPRIFESDFSSHAAE
jgi:hypothetical protein